MKYFGDIKMHGTTIKNNNYYYDVIYFMYEWSTSWKRENAIGWENGYEKLDLTEMRMGNWMKVASNDGLNHRLWNLGSTSRGLFIYSVSPAVCKGYTWRLDTFLHIFTLGARLLVFQQKQLPRGEILIIHGQSTTIRFFSRISSIKINVWRWLIISGLMFWRF
jgi:hypothetical protein